MGIPKTHAPADNTEAVITISAIPGGRIEIESVSFSFDEDPAAAAALTIESPASTVLWKTFVTKGGPGHFDFSGSCIRGAVGQALVVRLAAGGSGVAGVVNCVQRQS
jgi:hypothetical protein